MNSVSQYQNIKKKYKKRSQFADVWKRLKKNKMAMLGLVLLTIIILLAVFADFIADYENDCILQDISHRLEGPSKEHILGTDEFGRDIFARIIFGARISLLVGIAAVALGLLIGGMLGAISGFYGGRIDNIIMRTMDILLALPGKLLALTIVAALGANIFNLILAIGLSDVAKFARIVRASVISIKEQEYIEAARCIGAKTHTIILHHVLPNCLAPIVVQVTLKVATAILAISSLSFIGLGVELPTPEWGAMLSGGRSYLRDSVHLVLFPGLAIMITILSLNLLGDGLRDALDPRLK